MIIKNILGKVEGKSELAKIVMVDHKTIWEGVFKDLKDWLDTKKPISPNRLPCSEVSVIMCKR